MKPSELQGLLAFAIDNRFPVLVTGKPGIGKTDIITKASRLANADLVLSHPVVSDPTDYKGLPYASGGEANFLPYGDLRKAINATRPMVFFMDDIGQAPAAVQAALMQLLLAREINGQKISDHVVFLGATNRKEDKAAVAGLLEPVKSRFMTIVPLDVDTNDWVQWALTDGNQPAELIAFVRWKKDILDSWEPTKDLTNGPSPRTIAAVGKWQNAGLPTKLRPPVFKGAAGEAFAIEYLEFLTLINSLPNIDKILMAPDTVDVPTEPGTLFATITALASRVNDMNSANVFRYIERMPVEITTACVKDMTVRKPEITNTKAYAKWATGHGNFVMGG